MNIDVTSENLDNDCHDGNVAMSIPDSSRKKRSRSPLARQTCSVNVPSQDQQKKPKTSSSLVEKKERALSTLYDFFEHAQGKETNKGCQTLTKDSMERLLQVLKEKCALNRQSLLLDLTAHHGNNVSAIHAAQGYCGAVVGVIQEADKYNSTNTTRTVTAAQTFLNYTVTHASSLRNHRVALLTADATFQAPPSYATHVILRMELPESMDHHIVDWIAQSEKCLYVTLLVLASSMDASHGTINGILDPSVLIKLSASMLDCVTRLETADGAMLAAVVLKRSETPSSAQPKKHRDDRYDDTRILVEAFVGGTLEETQHAYRALIQKLSWSPSVPSSCTTVLDIPTLSRTQTRNQQDLKRVHAVSHMAMNIPDFPNINDDLQDDAIELPMVGACSKDPNEKHFAECQNYLNTKSTKPSIKSKPLVDQQPYDEFANNYESPRNAYYIAEHERNALQPTKMLAALLLCILVFGVPFFGSVKVKNPTDMKIQSTVDRHEMKDLEQIVQAIEVIGVGIEHEEFSSTLAPSIVLNEVPQRLVDDEVPVLTKVESLNSRERKRTFFSDPTTIQVPGGNVPGEIQLIPRNDNFIDSFLRAASKSAVVDRNVTTMELSSSKPQQEDDCLQHANTNHAHLLEEKQVAIQCGHIVDLVQKRKRKENECNALSLIETHKMFMRYSQDYVCDVPLCNGTCASNSEISFSSGLWKDHQLFINLNNDAKSSVAFTSKRLLSNQDTASNSSVQSLKSFSTPQLTISPLPTLHLDTYPFDSQINPFQDTGAGSGLESVVSQAQLNLAIKSEQKSLKTQFTIRLLEAILVFFRCTKKGIVLGRMLMPYIHSIVSLHTLHERILYVADRGPHLIKQQVLPGNRKTELDDMLEPPLHGPLQEKDTLLGASGSKIPSKLFPVWGKR